VIPANSDHWEHHSRLNAPEPFLPLFQNLIYVIGFQQHLPTKPKSARGETMQFCGKCGTSLSEGTAFCGNCGAPVTSSPGVLQTQGAGTSLTPNVAGLLSYVLGFITGIIFLVLEPYKNDKFVRFHAFQSIFFSVALTAFWILWNGILGALLWNVSFLLIVLGPISALVSLAAFLLWIFLMYKAYNNEKFMIPIIGEFAAKQAAG
jgi:uncharacterized membrane protein